jgi:KaiC/GvpD/RAD55 family RecA-like ATPase
MGTTKPKTSLTKGGPDSLEAYQIGAFKEAAGKLQLAQEELALAALRDPWEFTLYADRIAPDMFRDHKLGLAILATYSETGAVNAFDVANAAGHDPYELAARLKVFSKTPFKSFLENFLNCFSRFLEVELSGYALDLINQGKSGEEVRELVEQARRDKGAYHGAGGYRFGSRLPTYLDECLTGRHPEYLTVPPQETLREILPAFKPATLTVVAARPGMGKTLLAVNLVSHWCGKMGLRGAFATLEMSGGEIEERALNMAYGASPRRVYREGELEKEKLTQGAEWVAEWDLEIIEYEAELSQLTSRLRALHYQKSLDFIIIDYLQLMEAEGENRNNEISKITRRLKILAGQLGLPIILLSQLNRDLEKRADKRPIPSDLRDSGSIEADADNIIFIYRPEIYGITQLGNGDSAKGYAELIVAKQRNGDTGPAEVEFHWAKGFF